MSMYRAGIGADSKQITAQQWETENAALQKALKERIKTFPTKFTFKEAYQALDAAAQWGRKMLAKYGGNSWLDLFGRAVDTKGLQLAINTAENEFQKWVNKAPFPFTSAYVYEKNKNKEWKEVYDQVLRVYIEAAGVIGQRIVVDEAKRELQQDLNPVAPANILKIVAIAAAAAGGVVYILKSGKNRTF